MHDNPDAKVSLSKGADDGKRHKLLCSWCRHKTNHTTLQSIRQRWSLDSEGMAGYDDFLIVRCNGCDTLQFCKISSNSDDFDVIEDPGTGKMETIYLEQIDQYPSVNTSYEKPSVFHSMPTEIRDACNETYAALCNNLPKLGAAGTRLIIETLCIAHGIEDGNLKQKINALAEKGVITKSMRTMLHKVRLFGNSKLHTTETPQKNDLETAWSAVNNLLRSVYGTKDTNTYFKAFNEDKVKPKSQ